MGKYLGLAVGVVLMAVCASTQTVVGGSPSVLIPAVEPETFRDPLFDEAMILPRKFPDPVFLHPSHSILRKAICDRDLHAAEQR
jgi:hypothetical protein